MHAVSIPSDYDSNMVSFTLICCATLAAGVAGFVDAIAGGGGLIVLPTLLLLDLPPHYALSTNKFSATLGTASALQTFALSGFVLWKMALKGVFFSLGGAFIGSMLTLAIAPDRLSTILTLLLPIAFIISLTPKPFRKISTPCSVPNWKLFLICFVIGLYDGFFGPATGTFLIFAFHYFLAVELLQASATAKVLNLASNLASTLTFIGTGTMIWMLALPMAAGSILGNILGSKFAIKKGSESVRHFLSFSLFLLMATLLYKYFGQELVNFFSH